MHSFQNISENPEKIRNYFLAGAILLTGGSILSYLFEQYKLFALFLTVPIILIAIFNYQKYFKYIFIASLFIGGYLQWSFRIQFGLLASFVLVFFFMSENRTDLFNSLRLPSGIKKSGLLIIAAVYLSSFLTPHFSFFSVYYATIFLIFMLTSFVLFRSLKDTDEIDKLLYFFVIMNFISCSSAIFQIVLSGNLRSYGIAGMSQMDFAAFALVTIVFRNYLLSRNAKNSILFTVVILIVLITTQSRFAWLGFLLSFVYGIFICFIYSDDARKIIKKRIPIFLIILTIGISFIFVTGLYKVLIDRFAGKNFTLFQAQEGMLITNSLETRFLIWIVAINTFIHNPITGVGYLMFSETSESYNILPDYFFTNFVKDLDAHTTMLNFLCETGIIGLTAFIIYVVAIYRISLKSVKMSRTDGELKVSIVLNVLVFFVMVHSIYSGAFTMGHNALHMHFMFAFAVANYALLKNKYRSNDSI